MDGLWKNLSRSQQQYKIWPLTVQSMYVHGDGLWAHILSNSVNLWLTGWLTCEKIRHPAGWKKVVAGKTVTHQSTA
jgi:hypothetical protein